MASGMCQNGFPPNAANGSKKKWITLGLWVNKLVFSSIIIYLLEVNFLEGENTAASRT